MSLKTLRKTHFLHIYFFFPPRLVEIYYVILSDKYFCSRHSLFSVNNGKQQNNVWNLLRVYSKKTKMTSMTSSCYLDCFEQIAIFQLLFSEVSIVDSEQVYASWVSKVLIVIRICFLQDKYWFL